MSLTALAKQEHAKAVNESFRYKALAAQITPDLIYVVETYDDIYIGTVAVKRNEVRIRSGFVGHPIVLDVHDIVTITRADCHPDVEVL